MNRPTTVIHEWNPYLLADWGPVLFVHYAVEPERLQPSVPFPLDLREEKAYVSAVAFVQGNMRLARWPGLTRRLMRWLSNHPFLNLRTYVRVGTEPGIFFLAEWIPNRLDCLLGPAIYGLPYRHAKVGYDVDKDTWSARVSSREGAFACDAHWNGDRAAMGVSAGSIDEFLVERYTAFTMHRGVRRRFRIHHAPWPVTEARLDVMDDSLVRGERAWWSSAVHVGAHYTRGVSDVWIGRPTRLRMESTGRRVGGLTVILVATLAGVLVQGWKWPGWAVMWFMAGVLLMGFKWRMLMEARADGCRLSTGRMDAGCRRGGCWVTCWPGRGWTRDRLRVDREKSAECRGGRRRSRLLREHACFGLVRA